MRRDPAGEASRAHYEDCADEARACRICPPVLSSRACQGLHHKRTHSQVHTHTLLLLTVVFGFLYGAMLYYELQTQLRKAEAVALKYQQHQESLSAQLQDFLVYKLEAQETLNKGRSQHEELKKQHSDLEEEHRKQGEDFSRTFNDHKQRYLQLQQEKEQELSKLKGVWKSN
ncbi:hypothetical protein CB1_000700002 [Camelus ferus]|nr:hypothetical protein CB1_000700002 [Camelus ferus]